MGGGGYAASSYGAGSGHFQYYVVGLTRVLCKVFIKKNTNKYSNIQYYVVSLTRVLCKVFIQKYPQHEIAEDHTRIYVDVGEGGRVRRISFFFFLLTFETAHFFDN